MSNWIQRTFCKPARVPYNFGQPDCPTLKVGDRLLGVQENDAHDYIAGLCGMDMDLKAGYRVKWKVIEVYPEGDALLRHGSNRTLTKYMRWDDGNRVTVPATLSHSTILIRFFKLEY